METESYDDFKKEFEEEIKENIKQVRRQKIREMFTSFFLGVLPYAIGFLGLFFSGMVLWVVIRLAFGI